MDRGQRYLLIFFLKSTVTFIFGVKGELGCFFSLSAVFFRSFLNIIFTLQPVRHQFVIFINTKVEQIIAFCKSK